MWKFDYWSAYVGIILGLFCWNIGKIIFYIHDRKRQIQLRLSDNILPGWICSTCKAFNGEAKQKLTECRACGVKR